MDVDLVLSRYFYLYPFYRQVLELLPELTPAYIKKSRHIGEQLYVIRHVGVVIGVGRVRPDAETNTSAPTQIPILSFVIIRESYRRSGYATMLFEYIRNEHQELQIQIPIKFKSKKLLLSFLASRKFPNKHIFFEN